MSFARIILDNPAVAVQDRQEAIDRIYSDPGYPDAAAKTTESFWLQQPDPNVHQVQSSGLPSTADTVIIGSGITGTSIALSLLQFRENEKQDEMDSNISMSAIPAVVMLESRNTCSGATGRNGGHILETAEEYVYYEETYGVKAAKKILRFRLSHLQIMLDVAKQLGIESECQARKVRFLSVYLDQETWAVAKAHLKCLKEAMPEETKEWAGYDRENMPIEFKLPTAAGVISGPAGALWPYKLVTGILNHVRRKFGDNFRLETKTPVTKIERNPSAQGSSDQYSVTTPRVHCTNAHVSHLVPCLRGRVYPVRGQMSAQTPGEKFPAYGEKYSWQFNYAKGFDYLTQLPESSNVSCGEMMFGGGFAQGEHGGLRDMGVATDGDMSVYTDIHLSGALSAVFGRENWGVVPGPSVKSMWTGTMGFSSDGMPWVGRLPASTTQREGEKSQDELPEGGEWVSAGFSGEGMVNAWLCGEALAITLLAHDNKLKSSISPDISSWFPEQLLVTEERIKSSFIPQYTGESS
ncbi:FAD dependent oxidoreductase, putative [Talaromyces stipitatus ATCC 10500]|uniref:FAD dependent oxidoreductase, putative n=1 Tax=Talaromyces stipitatus (strain ATCC 10500 / CBS 375.48 / QM 6759 / NRRL 1006) TaxID=441959 RepID=B8MP09_TALSN|nr:FAD dependent oxidoreductase, putative [Talaromyces stipitatus ATCC 10500]EED14248.1 FAD dependent oxidoreductase, putative [Talaromyces stipitatus ATCC 10500]